LDLLTTKKINIEPLITHKFSIEKAQDAYNNINSNKDALGVLLSYGENDSQKLNEQKIIPLNAVAVNNSESIKKPVIGFIGAGNYASRVLIPAFKKTGVKFKTLVSKEGYSAVIHGGKNNFASASTDTTQVFNDEEINTVVIATRHNTHAQLALQALQSGKHVFLEKPLALTMEEVNSFKNLSRHFIEKNNCMPKLMLGFNRRFAPHTQQIKNCLDNINEPKHLIMTVNAGYIPEEHWTQNSQIGGGRLIGEACHFVDLLRYLVGHRIIDTSVISSKNKAPRDEQVTISLCFEDGSIGIINYLSNGHKSYPKETLDIFVSGNVISLNNFLQIKTYGSCNIKGRKTLFRQDKGQNNCVQAFITSIVNNKPCPIDFNEIIEVSSVCIELANRLI
jgi:predicted dehydrogenase